jgi:hypothetical protein
MWKWQMQLGIEDDEILPLLQVAQPGDHHWGEMTLERVRLNSGGVSRSMWKFLVCKRQQMTETVWLNAVRALGMPVSRISAEAVIRLGLTERPNEWCQVRPCNSAGRQKEGFLTKVASTVEIVPPEDMMMRQPREKDFRRPDVVIGTRDWDTVERCLRDPESGETACPHSFGGWREVVPEHVGERDRVVVQDHPGGGGQIRPRE